VAALYGHVRDVLSNLCIFGCRYLASELIYDDDAFTSLREAENLLKLTRYMFRFGLHEPFDITTFKTKAWEIDPE
jgi:hypothetical protein